MCTENVLSSSLRTQLMFFFVSPLPAATRLDDFDDDNGLGFRRVLHAPRNVEEQQLASDRRKPARMAVRWTRTRNTLHSNAVICWLLQMQTCQNVVSNRLSVFGTSPFCQTPTPRTRATSPATSAWFCFARKATQDRNKHER